MTLVASETHLRLPGEVCWLFCLLSDGRTLSNHLTENIKWIPTEVDQFQQLLPEVKFREAEDVAVYKNIGRYSWKYELHDEIVRFCWRPREIRVHLRI